MNIERENDAWYFVLYNISFSIDPLLHFVKKIVNPIKIWKLDDGIDTFFYPTIILLSIIFL